MKKSVTVQMGASADLALPIIFVILFSGVASRDMEVFVNDTVSIRCSPNRSVDIQWHHNSHLNYVYAGGRFFLPYKGRFHLEKDVTTGDYDLIIPNVTLEDAGLYLCEEELSGHRISSTQLTVLYVNPACISNMPSDGFVGPNTCDLQRENMTFSCDVKFNGRPPYVIWRSANDSQTFCSSSCEVKSDRSICSFTLGADPLYDGSVFICDAITSSGRRYGCNSDIIKVWYLLADHKNEEKKIQENANCAVRSNLNVQYKWTLKQNSELLSANQTISFQKSGIHQCKVDYRIRNIACSAQVLNVVVHDIQKERGNTLLAVTLPIALVVSVIALIGSTTYIWKLKRQVNLNKSSSEVEMPLIVNSCDSLLGIPLIFLDFKTTLNFRREKTLSENESSDSDMYEVIDVTKLKMKIYVLCAIYRSNRAGNSSEYESPMIYVFEDRNPYPIAEEISLKRFDPSEFTSIVSSVKENCLYVLTSSKIENHWVDEVIRVEIKENGANSPQHPSKWLELEEGYRPHTLSISKDDDLMMFNTFSPIILRIYDPDARLSLSVELHEDIVKTYKAVETSNGNFIVMHAMKRQTEYAEKGTHEEVETVSEMSRDGKTIIRRFIPQNQQQQLFDGRDLCTDSRDRVFVVDTNNDRVFVLDSCLRWIGILIPRDENGEMKQFRYPSKLLYDEVSHEVIIAEEDEFHIYYLVQCFPTCVPRHTSVPSGVPRLYARPGRSHNLPPRKRSWVQIKQKFKNP